MRASGPACWITTLVLAAGVGLAGLAGAASEPTPDSPAPAFALTAPADLKPLVDLVTGVDVAGRRASPGATLWQNVPNPFNPSTEIVFSIPSRSEVDLTVYDVEGRRVRTLVNGTLTEGSKRVVWDGRDARGAVVSSGVYFYTLRACGDSVTKKMILLK